MRKERENQKGKFTLKFLLTFLLIFSLGMVVVWASQKAAEPAGPEEEINPRFSGEYKEKILYQDKVMKNKDCLKALRYKDDKGQNVFALEQAAKNAKEDLDKLARKRADMAFHKIALAFLESKRKSKSKEAQNYKQQVYSAYGVGNKPATELTDEERKQFNAASESIDAMGEFFDYMDKGETPPKKFKKIMKALATLSKKNHPNNPQLHINDGDTAAFQGILADVKTEPGKEKPTLDTTLFTQLRALVNGSKAPTTSKIEGLKVQIADYDKAKERYLKRVQDKMDDEVDKALAKLQDPQKSRCKKLFDDIFKPGVNLRDLAIWDPGKKFTDAECRELAFIQSVFNGDAFKPFENIHSYLITDIGHSKTADGRKALEDLAHVLGQDEQAAVGGDKENPKCSIKSGKLKGPNGDIDVFKLSIDELDLDNISDLDGMISSWSLSTSSNIDPAYCVDKNKSQEFYKETCLGSDPLREKAEEIGSGKYKMNEIILSAPNFAMESFVTLYKPGTNLSQKIDITKCKGHFQRLSDKEKKKALEAAKKTKMAKEARKKAEAEANEDQIVDATGRMAAIANADDIKKKAAASFAEEEVDQRRRVTGGTNDQVRKAYVERRVTQRKEEIERDAERRAVEAFRDGTMRGADGYIKKRAFQRYVDRQFREGRLDRDAVSGYIARNIDTANTQAMRDAALLQVEEDMRGGAGPEEKDREAARKKVEAEMRNNNPDDATLYRLGEGAIEDEEYGIQLKKLTDDQIEAELVAEREAAKKIAIEEEAQKRIAEEAAKKNADAQLAADELEFRTREATEAQAQADAKRDEADRLQNEANGIKARLRIEQTALSEVDGKLKNTEANLREILDAISFDKSRDAAVDLVEDYDPTFGLFTEIYKLADKALRSLDSGASGVSEADRKKIRDKLVTQMTNLRQQAKDKIETVKSIKKRQEELPNALKKAKAAVDEAEQLNRTAQEKKKAARQQFVNLLAEAKMDETRQKEIRTQVTTELAKKYPPPTKDEISIRKHEVARRLARKKVREIAETDREAIKTAGKKRFQQIRGSNTQTAQYVNERAKEEYKKRRVAELAGKPADIKKEHRTEALRKRAENILAGLPVSGITEDQLATEASNMRAATRKTYQDEFDVVYDISSGSDEKLKDSVIKARYEAVTADRTAVTEEVTREVEARASAIVQKKTPPDLPPDDLAGTAEFYTEMQERAKGELPTMRSEEIADRTQEVTDEETKFATEALADNSSRPKDAEKAAQYDAIQADRDKIETEIRDRATEIANEYFDDSSNETAVAQGRELSGSNSDLNRHFKKAREPHYNQATEKAKKVIAEGPPAERSALQDTARTRIGQEAYDKAKADANKPGAKLPALTEAEKRDTLAQAQADKLEDGYLDAERAHNQPIIKAREAFAQRKRDVQAEIDETAKAREREQERLKKAKREYEEARKTHGTTNSDGTPNEETQKARDAMEAAEAAVAAKQKLLEQQQAQMAEIKKDEQADPNATKKTATYRRHEDRVPTPETGLGRMIANDRAQENIREVERQERIANATEEENKRKAEAKAKKKAASTPPPKDATPDVVEDHERDKDKARVAEAAANVATKKREVREIEDRLADAASAGDRRAERQARAELEKAKKKAEEAGEALVKVKEEERKNEAQRTTARMNRELDDAYKDRQAELEKARAAEVKKTEDTASTAERDLETAEGIVKVKQEERDRERENLRKAEAALRVAKGSRSGAKRDSDIDEAEENLRIARDKFKETQGDLETAETDRDAKKGESERLRIIADGMKASTSRTPAEEKKPAPSPPGNNNTTGGNLNNPNPGSGNNAAGPQRRRDDAPGKIDAEEGRTLRLLSTGGSSSEPSSNGPSSQTPSPTGAGQSAGSSGGGSASGGNSGSPAPGPSNANAPQATPPGTPNPTTVQNPPAEKPKPRLLKVGEEVKVKIGNTEYPAIVKAVDVNRNNAAIYHEFKTKEGKQARLGQVEKFIPAVGGQLDTFFKEKNFDWNKYMMEKPEDFKDEKKCLAELEKNLTGPPFPNFKGKTPKNKKVFAKLVRGMMMQHASLKLEKIVLGHELDEKKKKNPADEAAIIKLREQSALLRHQAKQAAVDFKESGSTSSADTETSGDADDPTAGLGDEEEEGSSSDSSDEDQPGPQGPGVIMPPGPMPMGPVIAPPARVYSIPGWP